MGPSDSTAMGWKRYWVPRFALAVLRSAADSAAGPALLLLTNRLTWHLVLKNFKDTEQMLTVDVFGKLRQKTELQNQSH